MSTRECLNCGNKVIGRSDKKYCSPQCRSEYYNQQHRENNVIISQVNAILRKNRQILSDLNPRGKRLLPQRKLLEKGFRFDYCTNYYTTKTGRTYYYCYDQGYHLDQEKDEVLLVVKQDYVSE